MSKQPILDNHILESYQTNYEIRDENGRVVNTVKLSNLNLGFDTVIETGKFYLIPSLHNFYYCDKIEGNLITWILVESYQHGHLLQAKITQKKEHARSYLEVTEKKRLVRLNKMLKNYRRPKQQ